MKNLRIRVGNNKKNMNECWTWWTIITENFEFRKQYIATTREREREWKKNKNGKLKINV